jgi:hypothetical protein
MLGGVAACRERGRIAPADRFALLRLLASLPAGQVAGGSS